LKKSIPTWGGKRTEVYGGHSETTKKGPQGALFLIRCRGDAPKRRGKGKRQIDFRYIPKKEKTRV